MKLLCVLRTGGEFNESHVEALAKQLGLIYCLTDSNQPMKNVISIPMRHKWPGWWSKMELFRLPGDVFYFDLDTVFKNGFPEEFKKLTETTVLADMYGGSHINSGLMFIKEEDKRPVWEDWIERPNIHMKEYRGDQDFLDNHWYARPRFQTVFPGVVVSYKADVLKGRTGNVVCFHGKPRPWEVDGWH